MPPLAVRRFTTADQEWFAALTGDANPLHLDPVAARRGLFGAPVVHGMHTAAWALDTWLGQVRAATGRTPRVASLAASFAKPVFLDEVVELHAERAVERHAEGAVERHADGEDPVRLAVHAGGGAATELRVRLTVHAGGGAATELRVRLADDAPAPLEECPSSRDVADAFPRQRSLAELDQRTGSIGVRCDREALAGAFPHACAVLGAGRLAGWLALSRLVGMECPGRDGLFSAFDVGATDRPGPALAYAVERADPRFSMARLGVGGSGWEGSVTAFVRPPPEAQPSMAEIASAVAPGAWAGQRALVVGGSRGLGEVTAKLVAAGGGHPVVTYRSGHEDAERVAGEIRAWGAACEAVALDVGDPEPALQALAGRGWLPTHVYYFATPRIFARRSRLFDPALFRTFAAVYVDGFLAVWEACRAVTDGPLRLFYPSSVAVEEDVRELTEYAAAKAAGESLCRSLDRFDRGTSVTVERLPRVATDQTLTLLPVPAADAATVMRGIVAGLAD